MKISDILRISIVGLSTFGMIHLARQGNQTSRNNPKIKTPPTEEELAQAKSLLAQTPQVIVDTIIRERANGLTSKKISMLIGYTTQQVWDIIQALELLGLIKVKKYYESSKKNTFDLFKRLHDIYMGPGRPNIEEVAKIGDMHSSTLLANFKKLKLSTKRAPIAKFEEARVRALFAEYTGPDLPTLVTLSKKTGMDPSTILRRFQALGLQAKIYGRTPARNVKLANPGIDFDELYADFKNIKIPLAVLESKYHSTLNQIVQALEYYEYPVEGKRFTQWVLWNTLYSDEIVRKYNSGMSIYEVYESFKDLLSLSVVVVLATRAGVVFRDTEPVVQYHLQGYSINRIQILTKLTYTYETIRAILKGAGYSSENNEESSDQSSRTARVSPEVSPEEIELQKKLPLIGSEILERIPKELFQNVYYQDSTTQKEKCKLLNISNPTFLKLKKYYGIQ